MSIEQLIEDIAQARQIAALSDDHYEVMKAQRERRRLEKLADKCGYDMREVTRKSRDRYLDLVQAY